LLHQGATPAKREAMVSADLHLLKRGGVYYWRRRIPRSFAPGFGSSHILLSLRVREPASARRLGRRLSVIFDEAMQAIELEQRTPSIQELKSILKRLYSLILDRCEREAANTYAVEEIPEEAFDSPPPEREPGSADEAAWLAAHEEAYMFGDPAERSEAFRRCLDENRLKPIRWLLEPILAEFGIDAGSDDVEFRRFLREATMFAIRAYEDAARKIAAADPGREINIILDSVRRETRAAVPVNGGRALATSATEPIPRTHCSPGTGRVRKIGKSRPPIVLGIAPRPFPPFWTMLANAS
jgi:hypothetical protein